MRSTLQRCVLLLWTAMALVVGQEVPSQPFLDLTVISGDAIRADFFSPLSDGGSAIHSYKVEWDTDPGLPEIQTLTTSTYTGPNEIQSITTYASDINEVQVVKTFATEIQEVQRVKITEAEDGFFFLELDTTATGGSIQYSGYIEVNFPGSGSRHSVEDIINEMSNVAEFGTVNVTRNIIDSEEYEYVVTFPVSMGNVPEMRVHTAELYPSGTANAEVSTVTDGNILGGTFRLTFEEQTTADIDFDASEAEMREALERLTTIGSVEVTRSAVDDQHGYEWTIEFTSDMNDGDIDILVADTTSLTVSSTDGEANINITATDGNELSGSFTLEYGGSVTDNINFNATSSEFKAALEDLNSIPAGTISVSRTGPDGELAYSWTVTFLSDYNRTHEGDLDPFVPDMSLLNGQDKDVTVIDVRTGTWKEVQEIAVVATSSINSTTMMVLGFDNATTNMIPIRPSSGSCVSGVTEVHTITSSTMDTTTSGGDDTVSGYLQFRIKYEDEVTSFINANPNFDGDCSVAASAIESELEKLTYFDDVLVTYVSTGISQGCVWTIDFVSSIGDLETLTVQCKNTLSSSMGSVDLSSVAGDDTVTTTTLTNGEKDAIKAQLELLENVGTVTVTAGDITANGECVWRVTFDTNAGVLPLMTVAVEDSSAVAASAAGHTTNFVASDGNTIDVSISQLQASTSDAVGGYFAMSFRNQRTRYVPHDASAREIETALEALDTIGDVTVTRSPPDENDGYTWSVIFLTEAGDVDMIVLDDLDMTGTVVSCVAAVEQIGVSPPFDSLDQNNGLPLGSAVVTDLTDLTLTITDLEEGIAYFVRVSAINSIGQGDFAFADVPFAIPEPQRPGRPTDTTLEVIDGTSMLVGFNPPALDGGDDVTFYRVEYGSNAFVQEIQEVSILSEVVNEVQVVSSYTDDYPEVQILHISTDYAGVDFVEEQTVVCDATGGSFRFSFNGYYSSTIPYSASAETVKAALEEMAIINSVTVTFLNGITTACFENANFPSGAFTVTFDDVVDMSGNLPMLKAYTNNLQGLRRVDITESVQGDAGAGGFFRISFRGSTTEDLSATSTDAQLLAALENLDTIPDGGVTVDVVDSSTLSSVHDKQWRITFSHVDLGGDVEDIVVENFFNRLTGTNVNINVWTNGLESLTERGNAVEPSRRGNEITGGFTVTYRGHTTDIIDYNAANTVFKTRLEALPNVGTVEVERVGPTVQNEYSWSVTFVSMPGSFPVGSGDFEMLVPNIESLNGNNTMVNVTEQTPGSDILEGSFSLSFSNGTFSETTEVIPVDASASEMGNFMNGLNSIGTVTVSRTKKQNGFIWLITFDGCKIVDGEDVCAVGDIPTLGINGTNTATAMSTNERLRGVGPDACDGSSSGLCQDYITDLSGAAPYQYIMNDLTSGNPYYVRIFAHNMQGYGFSAITTPEFAIPTNNPPGAPPMVRLVESTMTSIKVEWDFPRENGGAPVMGFELWMDDWSGGNPRLVFDGTDNPSVTSFTVHATQSLRVESGKSYRFLVRAVNYCKSTDKTKACYGEFSHPAVFAVRAPRVPLAPPMPWRHSKSSIGSQNYGDANITIRWDAPIDNGGSPVTDYMLYYAPPGTGAYTVVPLDSAIPVIASASGELVMEATVSNLNEGDVYRFYVVAINAKGRSANSPILSVVAGIVPGVDAFAVKTYESVLPQMTSIEAGEISLSWAMPAFNSTGGTPITGYKVYMFPGVGLNTLANPNPVHKEIQMISTYVDPRVSEVQKVTITNATSGTFTLSVYGVPTSALGFQASGADVSAALQDAFTTAGYVGTMIAVNMSTLPGNIREYVIDFGAFSEESLELLVLDSLLENSDAINAADPDHPVPTSVERLRRLNSPISGSFTLSYNGTMSIDMPYDVSAEEMKVCLEDLPGIWYVSVERKEVFFGGDDRVGYQWIVTFDAAAGDLPMLYATPGRLEHLSSGVSIVVTEGTSGV